MFTAMLAGRMAWALSSLTDFATPPASCLVFLIPLFNLMIATRWSFHVFNRMVRTLATFGHRFAIVGADARGQAAVMHLFNARNSSAGLIGVIDDYALKRGKVFPVYRCSAPFPTSRIS